MRFGDIKRRMVVHTLEHGKIYVLENKRGELRGTRMERPYGGQSVTIMGTPDEDMHVTSYRGAVLYKGITGAEITAQEAALRLAEAGVDVEYEVQDTEHGNRLASIRVKTDMFSDSMSATWRTPLAGRRTTSFLCGTLYRSPFRSSRKRSFVKLTQKMAYREIGNFCWMHEYRRDQRSLGRMEVSA